MTGSSALYIVATPIGNLDDISVRAIEVLKSVDLIAAEDTRHSRRLMSHLGVETPLMALHEHSSEAQISGLIEKIESGSSVALVSDAGTPLISDPGFPLVALARKRGVTVYSVPGACAVVTALAASGLPSDRFCFEGFLPSKHSARLSTFEALAKEARTMVFYEAPHRILDSLNDAAKAFGSDREAVLARELTKTFETYLSYPLGELKDLVERDPMQQKGEMVLMIKGFVADANQAASSADADKLLKLLLKELPQSKAASLAAKITGSDKKLLYARAMELKDS